MLRNRFKILKPLGQGGFGKTYLAEDTDKLNRPCVIKQLFYQGQSSNANQKIIELFMREAEQLDRLKANQQIPDLLAYFEEEGYLYLAQEYVDGGDLLKELQTDGPFSAEKIKELLFALLPVLAFIHSKGLIHRDLKPENIMRRKLDGRLVLIDFGVARQISMSKLSLTGTKVGSPGYFSVEQFAEGKATASSDLYSCFHLLTGQYPGDLWTMQGYGWVNNWQDYLSHAIDSQLAAILDKLLQVRSEDRYQSADEVLADLNQSKAQAEAEKLQRYEAEFSKAVRSAFPLEAHVRDKLKQFQRSIGLADAEVVRIEQPILKQAEAERQERIKQQAEARQQAEAQRQEQLRQEAEAKRLEQLKQSENVGNSSSLVSKKTNRRQFLTLAAFGGVGLGSVLLWEAIRNLTNSSNKLADQSFEFEVVSVDEVGDITNRKRERAEFFTEELDSGNTLEMVLIPGGTFTMGSPSSELGTGDDEGPQHEVTVPSFYLGKYQVTQAQWEAIMGSNPSNFKGANQPVENVSWEDAVEFCQKLSQESGKDYRLPSEAEWEYACRAGTTTPFYFGETITPALANYNDTFTYGSGPKGDYRKQTTEVGSFPPNVFGLYDMHGNVDEWCQDHWHKNYDGAPTDGSAWIDKNDNDSRRIRRGGSWFYNPRYCRSASRSRSRPDFRADNIGFRVVCSAPSSLP
ncbi:bifunctional serine/threonine-protein kinase/formylglycine-generating enzyme family protein [Acaryochloris sp. IP29b_bin.137]|uniref:bifunctional serine/threonine-protein kinase/formylglycine-generating enzyme family protein n=1 Tax=Acaryochloris sp. IP29b_bin.137 TaxID=2969217 RepID=UPI00344F6493